MINCFRGQYAFLSNFYEAPVTYQGLTYRNNEAAFQAQKCMSAYQVDHCEKPLIDERIRFATLSASDAKRLGREITLRKDWEEIKVEKMREIVKAKFDQNDELREQLMQTGDEYLEEGNTWGDRIWGTVNGSGANLLGQILTEYRERYRYENRETESLFGKSSDMIR